MKKQIYELNIDPELESFMTPLSDEETENLENSIIHNGCRRALVVWNKTIVDGHHRYAICHKHGIPFAIEEQEFADKQEAMLWMYQEQTAHRNLGTVSRVIMALKCKPILLEKGKEQQGYRSDLNLLFKKTKSHNTRKMLAELADTSETTVQKIETVWEKADADLKDALLKGTISVNKAYRQVTQVEWKDRKAGEKNEMCREAHDCHGACKDAPMDDQQRHLAGFTNEQLEVELYRRQNHCVSTEDAIKEMRRSIAPAPGRIDMEIPIWEGGVDRLYNVIANGFCRNLWEMIHQTDKTYLTQEAIDVLLDRLDELYDDAGNYLNEALKDKFGANYHLDGFD